MKDYLSILIVEDEPMQVRLITEYINEIDFSFLGYSSFEIQSAGTLKESIELIEKFQFDVVLTDLNLPDSIGLSTLLGLYKINSNIPIVIMTGINDENLAIESIGKGAQDFIGKSELSPATIKKALIYSIERIKLTNRISSLVIHRTIISQVNTAITTYKDPIGLISFVCNLLIELGNFNHAFAGKIHPDQSTETPVLHFTSDNTTRIKEEHSFSFSEIFYDIDFISKIDKSDIFFNSAPDFEANHIFIKKLPGIDSAPFTTLFISGDKQSGFFLIYLIPHINYKLTDENKSLLFEIYNDINFGVSLIYKEQESKKVSGQLTQSEAKYSELFSRAIEGIAIADPETGIIVECNNALLSLVERDRDEVVGQHQTILHPPEDTDGNFSNSFALQAAGKVEVVDDCKLLTKSGVIKYASIKASLIETNGKKLLQGFFFDTTESKKHREQLEESERKYKILFHANPNPMWVFHKVTHKFLMVNAAAIRHYGYSEDEFLSMTLFDIRPESEHLRLSQNLTTNVNGYQKSALWKHKKKDGSIIDVEIISEDVSFLFEGMSRLVLVNDITQKLKFESQNRLLSKAVDQSMNTIIMTSIDGNIIYANSQCENVSGYSVLELIGKNPRIFGSSNNSKEKYKELWETILSGNEWRGEFLNKKKSGEFYWESALITPVKDDSGHIINFIAIKEDITEQKRNLEELITAKEKAEEVNRLKSHFFYNMSHELRTPFVSIMGNSEILYEELEDSDLKKFAQAILKSSERLTITLNKILELSNIEFGEKVINLESFDFLELLTDIKNTFEPKSAVKGINFQISSHFSKLLILSDRRIIKSIIENLVDNAIKYTISGKVLLEITEQSNSHSLVICVKDTGIGIPHDKLELIWEEFRQVSEGIDRVYEGSGLGLALVKKYVSLLHGKASVSSQVDIGSEFKIEIPVNFGESEKIQIENPGLNEPDNLNPPEENRKHILLIEDDVYACDIIQRMLKTDYMVDIANNSEMALSMVKMLQYELILMDINLGYDIDGIALMRLIKQIPEYSNIPFVTITAYARLEDKKFFLSEGMDDYIAKPFRKVELISLVDNYLKKES
ncbi:MAG: PAS domain S-box protein [Ignavibacteriaceae bacterium]|nr:PAS domain S-box protein [Ignavibacteriaceae bacterium]